jgi:hypothetical protein
MQIIGLPTAGFGVMYVQYCMNSVPAGKHCGNLSPQGQARNLLPIWLEARPERSLINYAFKYAIPE